MLGHELRNPLDVIGNAVRVLNTAGSPRRRSAAGPGSDRASGRPARSARQRPPRYRPRGHRQGQPPCARLIDLGRDDAARCIQRSLKHQTTPVSTRSRVQAEPIWIDADPIRVEQIVNESLVERGEVHPPAGGSISTSRLAGDGQMGSGLQLRDTGMGIEARHDRAGSSSSSSKGERALDRTEGGLGIGLTLVRPPRPDARRPRGSRKPWTRGWAAP